MNISYKAVTLVLLLAQGLSFSVLLSMESQQKQEKFFLSNNNQRILALGTGLGLGGICMYYTSNVRPYIGQAIKEQVKKEFENVKNKYQDNSTVLKLAGGLVVIFGLNHLINNWCNQPARLVLPESPKVQELAPQKVHTNTIVSTEPKKANVLMYSLIPIRSSEEKSNYTVEKIWFDRRAKSIVKNGYEIGSKNLAAKTVNDWFLQDGQLLLPIEDGIAHWNGACNYGNGNKIIKVYVDTSNKLQKLVCYRRIGITNSTCLLVDGENCSLITAATNGTSIGCVYGKKQVVIFEGALKKYFNFDQDLTALAFNQQNTKFAVATNNNQFIVIMSQFAKPLGFYSARKVNTLVTSFAFTSYNNSNVFAVGYADGMIGYFMSDTNTWLYWQAHEMSIDEIKLLDNNQTVISCSTLDKKIKKWSLADVAKAAFNG